MVLLNAFRRRFVAGNPEEGANPQAGGNPRGEEAVQEVGRARNARQPWENHVIVRAIRRMRIVGLRQALQPNISLPKRIFWVGVFFICIWFTIHMLWLAVNEYNLNPTSNTMHDDVPINRGPFPGVTVAGTGTFKASGIDEATNMKFIDGYAERKSWTVEGVRKLLHTIDHFCEMVFSFADKFKFLDELQKMYHDWHTKYGDSDFLRDDPTDPVLIQKVLPYIRDNTVNCSDILLVCMWDGEEDDCDTLFVPVLTDIGIGCSFNRIPEKILRTSTGLMSLLLNHTRVSDEEYSAWDEWNTDDALREAVEKFKSPRKFPRTQSAAGIMKGISFLLLHDVIQNFSCPATSSSGFLVAVHSPFEEPQMLKDGVGTPALHEVFIKVKGELRIVDKELRDMPKEKRKCYFQDESKLKIFRKYTLANCQSECRARAIAKNCHCQQLLMSTGKNESLCGPSKIDCVRNITRDLDRDGYNETCGDLQCLPPCSDVKYETSVSYLPYNVPSIFEFYDHKHPKLRRLGPQSITSIVHVYQESTSLLVRRLTVFLLYSFIIGTIFGILGWTLEFTVESIFKVVDGLFLLLAALYQKILARTNNQSDVPANPNVPNNQNSPLSNQDGENVGNRDNDYDSSSEDENSRDEPSPPDDVNQHCDTMQPLEVEGSVVEGLRKTLHRDLKKTVKTEVSLLKNELHSQIQVELKDLRNEVKETAREDLTRSKEEMIALLKTISLDLKATNEALMMKCTNQLRDDNQALMKILRDDNQALMQTFVERASPKDATTSKSKSRVQVKTTTACTNTDTPETETEITPDDKLPEEVNSSCASAPSETTHVQTINETHSRLGHERFKRTSHLAVLFTRRTSQPSSSSQIKHNENDTKLLRSEVSSDLEVPQETISRKQSLAKSAEEVETGYSILHFPQRPTLSAQLLDVDDQSDDDDVEETIIHPKNC